MRLFILVIILTTWFSGQALSLTRSDVWDIPFDNVIAKTIKTYSRGSVQVEEVYYESRNYKGKPARIFGYFCRPKAIKKDLPAVLLVHGGGGGAKLGTTVAWAKRGYAVLSIDLPGKGEQRARSRSTGPNMDVPTLLRTTPEVAANYLVHAIAATRKGITYLTKRPEVDKDRIGMVGLSWGGVITLLTNGQDKRLATAVNVFGAGYIPEGCTWQTRFDNMSKQERAMWDYYIDPKNFLRTQHAPMLFITGTNDHCYYLPTFQKSYLQATVSKKLYLVPNLRHKFLADTQNVVWAWLDSKLKKETSFPTAHVFPIEVKDGERLIIPIVPNTPGAAVKDVTLYYVQGQPIRWTKREWQSLKPYQEDGVYYFSVPFAMIKSEMMFFVNLSDSKGAVVSTPIRSIFKLNVANSWDTYAITAPINRISQHARPLEVLGVKNLSPTPRIHFSKDDGIYRLISSAQVD